MYVLLTIPAHPMVMRKTKLSFMFTFHSFFGLKQDLPPYLAIFNYSSFSLSPGYESRYEITDSAALHPEDIAFPIESPPLWLPNTITLVRGGNFIHVYNNESVIVFY